MKKFLLSTVSLLALFSVEPAFAKGIANKESPLVGIVNFANCITDSKYGKKEQENMENLRKQMASLIENTEKELHEINAKFEDTEYLDSLSPKAEEELKIKQQALREDLDRYQQQFYQVLNHANYQMVQKLSNNIATASEIVGKEQGFDYVINREACFYTRAELDVTNLVITEMDKNFDLSEKGAKKVSDNKLEESLPVNAVDETALDRAG